MLENVLVTGGAGYVGSVLVPKLLHKGYRVKVVDLYLHGEDTLEDHPNLEQVKGDIRDQDLMRGVVDATDAIIHLAYIANDPNNELSPELEQSINYDAFVDIVRIAKENGVRRFVFASSSSVYGIKEEVYVTEDLSLEPLTNYARHKAMCEEELLRATSDEFETLIIRPASICGYSPRLRLDLMVNAMTALAIVEEKIAVFGGQQMRPVIHIEDITDLYADSLLWDSFPNGEVFNAGCGNFSALESAEIIRNIIGSDISISLKLSNDFRSYRISSEKIWDKLKFVPMRTIGDGIRDLVDAFVAGKVWDIYNTCYNNVKTLQACGLQ